MPDNIERTIYKLEMDESNYVRGADRAAQSTENLSRAQDEANKKLRQNQEALARTSANLFQYRQELENAQKSTNTGVIKEREALVKKAEEEQQRLIKSVQDSKVEYDKATEAVNRFEEARVKAAESTPVITPSGQPISPALPQTPVPEITENIRSLIDTIDQTAPEAFANVLLTTAENMDLLRVATEHAEEELEKMVIAGKQNSQEFKDLNAVWIASKKILEEFTKASKETTGETTSYKSQINAARLELQKLEAQGKQNTQEYIEQEKRIVALTRAYNDQRQRIRILASETRLLDFGKASIQTALTGFKALTSTTILFGNASEELQKKVFKLFAAMELLNSIEQLNIQLKAVSTIRTNAQSAATAAYTAIVGAATGASKAFRLALAGTGIGIAIAGIAFLVNKLIELREAQEAANKQQKLFDSVNEEAAKSVAASVTKIILFRDKLNDLSVSQKDRIRIAKEYNKIADEQNKIDIKQIDNLGQINQLINNQIILLEQRALAAAASAKLTEQSNKVIESELKISTIAGKTGFTADNLVTQFEAAREEAAKKVKDEFPETLGETFFQALTGGATGTAVVLGKIDKYNKSLAKAIKEGGNIDLNEDQILQLIKLIPEKKKAIKDLDEMAESLKKFFTVSGLTTPPPPPKNIDNVFDEERQRLLEKLQQLRNQELEGIEKINAEFALKFQQEQERIAKLLKDKKLTIEQAFELTTLAAKVNKTELDQALDAFRLKVIDSRIKLNEQIEQLERQNAQDSINLLQDDFNKRAQIIAFNEQKETEQVLKAGADRLQQFEEQQRTAGAFGLGEEEAGKERIRITQETEQQITNITLRAAQERQKLSADIFRKSLEQFDQIISDSKLIGDKAALTEIQNLVVVFQQGKITYEQYKKDLAAIQKKYEDQQLEKTIDTLEKEIIAIRVRLGTELKETDQEYKDLIKLVGVKEAELIAARTKQATGGINEPKPKEVEKVSDYVDAIGQLTQSVIQFWQGANQAEEEALNRSITLQERRVNEAIRIAERGNASYLKMEEDKLKQLEVARENAARRQIAVNAAVQASQILVGIAGAIAKLAEAPPGFGVAATIAEIAVITSSLAAGYALVRSLQNNQPKFATGEKYVRRKNNEPQGTDTIPAWLTEGEAVITKQKNKEYHPVISAIHDGSVPASYLNKQVERYFTNTTERHTIKSVPQPHYEKIKETAETHIASDSKLASLISDQNRKIDEGNFLQRKLLDAMKGIKVDAKIDRDGIAIAVNEYVEQLKIDRFT